VAAAVPVPHRGRDPFRRGTRPLPRDAGCAGHRGPAVGSRPRACL